MRSRWNPWRNLRALDDVELVWTELDGCRGMVEEGPPRRLHVDPRLRQAERSAVVGHEVVHLELGLLYTPSTPPGIVEAYERIVRRETADRFVPPDELAAFVAHRAEVGPVDAHTVADEFDCTVEIALDAMRLLAHRQADDRSAEP